MNEHLRMHGRRPTKADRKVTHSGTVAVEIVARSKLARMHLRTLRIDAWNEKAPAYAHQLDHSFRGAGHRCNRCGIAGTGLQYKLCRSAGNDIPESFIAAPTKMQLYHQAWQAVKKGRGTDFKGLKGHLKPRIVEKIFTGFNVLWQQCGADARTQHFSHTGGMQAKRRALARAEAGGVLAAMDC